MQNCVQECFHDPDGDPGKPGRTDWQAIVSASQPLTQAASRLWRRPTDNNARPLRWRNYELLGNLFFFSQDIECRIVNIEKYGKHHQKKICNEVGGLVMNSS